MLYYLLKCGDPFKYQIQVFQFNPSSTVPFYFETFIFRRLGSSSNTIIYNLQCIYNIFSCFFPWGENSPMQLEICMSFSKFITFIRYQEYRNAPWEPNPYKRPPIYWHVLAARLAFVVVFQVRWYFLLV